MISATSSVTSGLLSSAFGTSAPSASTIPGGISASNASLVEGLLPSSPDGGLLSNLIFGQDTEALLNDPFSNGAIGGTPSSYVQQIIQKLAPGAPLLKIPMARKVPLRPLRLSQAPIQPPRACLPKAFWLDQMNVRPAEK